MSKKILVVEDEKAISRVLETYLLREGFEVEAVFDGESALNLLQQNEFGFIILDLMLPKINGFEVLKELQTRGVTTSVVVYSNLSHANVREQIKELGAKNFYSKSSTPVTELVAEIKTFLQIS